MLQPRPLLFEVASRLLFPALLALIGCAGVPHQDLAPAQPPHEVQSALPSEAGGIVFSADGAGGFQATSNALEKALTDKGEPLTVEAVRWSHGWGRILSDEMGYQHSREAGQRLAERVAAFQAAHPQAPVYLVGHSAGAAVVLTAAENLPPDSVERIILLAPAVSADFDLRPALRSTRRGIEVFCSRRDWWYLGIGVALVGTADGHWRAAAGRDGFKPVVVDRPDSLLYQKLHQHCWDRSMEWTGNRGGHYGAYQVEYLKAYVLQLFDYRGKPRPSDVARFKMSSH
jgi:pimeloyl-ACP methyl ester carboxylesterase